MSGPVFAVATWAATGADIWEPQANGGAGRGPRHLNGGERSMATQDEKNATDLGEQAIALAEQLGRIAGTIEGTAESWLNREKLTEQLTRVRDGATQMLEGLTAGAERTRK